MNRKLLSFLFLLFAINVPLGAQDISPEKVKQAIEGGVSFLREKQLNSGGWQEYNNEESCGRTALVVISLVAAGVDKNDPVLTGAMDYLRRFNTGNVKRTYSMSLLCMAFALVDPKRDALNIRDCVKWLEDSQKKDANNPQYFGGWHYTFEQNSTDNSCSQFAILALYEAERAGIPVKEETWLRAKAYWEHNQNTDGGWGYSPQRNGGSGGSTGSMTTAGIASMIVTSGVLSQGGARVRGQDILCCQNVDDETREKIQRGIDWMARHFSTKNNPGHNSDQYLYYYLYGLERVGRMSANRFIGEYDWYREGTKSLLEKVGNFAKHWSGGGTSEVDSTAFALLFLSKGRRPILVSKIQYGNTNAWNAHPNDVNNLAEYAMKLWEKELTWQNVELERASIEDLLQSPVIYICGNQSPLPHDRFAEGRLVEKLRGYLDQGGFIFAEAYADDKSFDRGFRELMRKVLPEEGYELRYLEEEHPIWHAEKNIAPDQLRRLEGIDFGCRTSVVYAPPSTYGLPSNRPISAFDVKPSLSCLWELAKVINRGEKYPASVQHRIDNGLGIGINVLAYATNREFEDKIERSDAIAARRPGNPADRGRIYVGLLKHGGGSNCAPRAIPRLMSAVSHKFGTRINTSVEEVQISKDSLAMHPIIFMHGRTAFRFTDEERKILREYVENGGFLFANAVCASKAFSESFRREMKMIFPDKDMEDIELTDPLFSDEYDGSKIERLELRVPQNRTGKRMEVAIREVPPNLSGIRKEHRWSVVFSPYDVSCALEKTNSLECEGYTPASALELGINVFLYALKHQ